ncbi:MAG: SET domain-containing protein-lysine N-methyltransferase, partial [Verrucomicrobiota bacterium]
MAESTIEPTTSEFVAVEASGIHQKGVFARTKISKDTLIIQYVGEKITKSESERRGWAQMEHSENTGDAAVYIFDLDRKHDLDGNFPYNTARLINHTCDPNCEAQNLDGEIWIVALREIKKGEELGFDYGFDLESFEEHPCLCGSPKCV